MIPRREPLRGFASGTATCHAPHSRRPMPRAPQVGIPPEHIYSRVSPTGKADIVRAMQQGGIPDQHGAAGLPIPGPDPGAPRLVGFVGDGINDAGALAVADVGAAMAGGVDLATDIADAVLQADRPSQAVALVEAARAGRACIRRGLTWALAYNALAIPAAAGLVAPLAAAAHSPSAAAGMMAANSLGVLANALLLRRTVNAVLDKWQRV